MGFFEFVITVVSMSFGFVLLLQFLKNRGDRRRYAAHSAQPNELAELRGRIEALEAIVTDERTRLAREIDSLEREPRRAVGSG